MAKKKAAAPPEKMGGGESGGSRWMLTYLDMVTLLFGVFVILYAMSSVEKHKFDEVSAAIRESFMSGLTFVPAKKQGGKNALEVTEGSPQRNDFSEIISTLKPEIRNKFIAIRQDEKDLYITIFDQEYFATGSSELSQEMKDVLRKVADFMTDSNGKYDMRIEAHTDERPVTKPGQSDYNNWNLSADRSVNILKFLESTGVPSGHLAAVAYGSSRPLNLDGTPEARAMNRRVDLAIITDKKYRPNYRAVE
jgi:chemotaxis protein MotB